MQKTIFFIGVISTLAIGAGDWAMKQFTIEHFADGNSVPILPFVDFVLHKNPGITGDIAIPMIVIIPLTFSVILFLLDRASISFRADPIITLGAIAIISGATNNLIDRIINGFTTDYLMFFSASIINGSDVLIVLGMGTIFWYTRNNPHALRNFIQPSPPHYGVISCLFSSVIRFVRHSSHR